MEVVSQEVKSRFLRLQMNSLIGVWIGYAAYYLVRSNFNLALPYLSGELDLSKTQLGLLSSCLLITYGLSKGFMSVLADKANPKYFMAIGLTLCVILNVLMGFTTHYSLFIGLVILLGLFQGMGVGPSIITVGYWFPRSQRGRASTIWNMSHNLGGGIVAPIVGVAIGYLGTEHWRIGTFAVPAILAAICVLLVLYFVRKRPTEEGLPTVEEVFQEEAAGQKSAKMAANKPENMNAFQVFTKTEMSVAYMLFEWAAIPSTILAGYLVDKYFKGRIMQLPIYCLVVIFACVIGYMNSDSILWATVFACITGCLIYIPQSMIPVQAMEVIPTFALGSAVGLRGFMSYLVGSSLGTTLFGFVVDHWGWDMGFYTLLVGVVLCMFSCYLSNRGVQKIYAAADKV